MKLTKTEQLIKSRKRQRDHGEVYTPSFVVEKMLDMVPLEKWKDPIRVAHF